MKLDFSLGKLDWCYISVDCEYRKCLTATWRQRCLFLYIFFKIFIRSSWRQGQGGLKRCRRPDFNKVFFSRSYYPNYYWSYFITLYMHGWCIWGYHHRLILNLSYFRYWRRLKQVYVWSICPLMTISKLLLVQTSPNFINDASYDTYVYTCTTDSLEC